MWRSRVVTRVLASSLAETTPWLTVSSELTTPGGASQVGDRVEEGFVLDRATLVHGDEDLNDEDVLETILVLGMRTPVQVVPGKPATPRGAATQKRYCNVDGVDPNEEDVL